MGKEREYLAAGMDAEAIAVMRSFDWDAFKRQRVFCQHNQYLESFVHTDIEEAGKMASFYKQFQENFIIQAEEVSDAERFSWIEKIEDNALYEKLHKMKDEDLELLTLLVMGGYTVVEIARLQGVSHAAVSKKISRLKK